MLCNGRNRIVVLAAAILFAGCEGRTVDPPDGHGAIGFALEIPANRPSGEYYVTSGVVNDVVAVKVGDSIVNRDIQTYGAQFTRAADAVAMPLEVSVNGSPLARHRDGDTLRLKSASDTSLLGSNTWRITDSSQSSEVFTSPVLDVVDSVAPFRTLLPTQAIRSDSSLTIRWQRPKRASGGMYIEWRAPNDTLRYTANDGIGILTIPSEDMMKLRGSGHVVLTRYLNATGSFHGLRVVISRLAQRSYEVTVQ